jgi:hypothetical protein
MILDDIVDARRHDVARAKLATPRRALEALACYAAPRRWARAGRR